MFRRSAAVNLVAVLVLLTTAGVAQAHRLDAQVFVRPFGVVRVESWFETGDVPTAARVEVFRDADGSRLTDGKTDAEGFFTFAYADREPLRVVVDAGAGHRAEVRVKKAELDFAAEQTKALGSCIACLTPQPSALIVAPLLVEVRLTTPAAPPAVERRTGPQVERLALGVGLLLSVAGGAMLVRRARRNKAPVSDASQKRSSETLLRSVANPSTETPRPAAPPTDPGRH